MCDTWFAVRVHCSFCELLPLQGGEICMRYVWIGSAGTVLGTAIVPSGWTRSKLAQAASERQWGSGFSLAE
eukprot:jgi/Botrbrau1/6398/Bobra.49_1s0016.1